MAGEITMLGKVKTMLGITGTYQDETVQAYIDEVTSFLIHAGVSRSQAENLNNAGLVAMGVNDLWMAGGQLSGYFTSRAIQLSLAD